MTHSSTVSEGHLTDLEIAAYLDRGLEPKVRDRIEAHLATCDECRDSLVKSEALIAANRMPRRLMVSSSLIAVAAVLAIVAIPAIRSASDNRASITRDLETRSITGYSPGDIAERRALRFTWSAVAEAVDYRLVVALPDGTTLWSATTRDTTTTIPDSVTLQPARAYVWSTDAELEDGSVVSTGLRRFTISR